MTTQHAIDSSLMSGNQSEFWSLPAALVIDGALLLYENFDKLNSKKDKFESGTNEKVEFAPVYWCIYCEIRFDSKEEEESHIREYHSDETREKTLITSQE